MFLLIVSTIWIYLLTIFKRKKLDFFYFLIGSVGFFMIILIGFRQYCFPFMINITTEIMNGIGKLTKLWIGYKDYGIIFIANQSSTISLNIDYECSGFIECLVYLSLVFFYPLFSLLDRVKYSIIGILYILFANILRLSIISITIHFFGNDVYYIAHSVIGRIIFFILILILYFYIFTRTQILKQKVGNFNYDKEK